MGCIPIEGIEKRPWVQIPAPRRRVIGYNRGSAVIPIICVKGDENEAKNCFWIDGSIEPVNDKLQDATADG